MVQYKESNWKTDVDKHVGFQAFKVKLKQDQIQHQKSAHTPKSANWPDNVMHYLVSFNAKFGQTVATILLR